MFGRCSTHFADHLFWAVACSLLWACDAIESLLCSLLSHCRVFEAHTIHRMFRRANRSAALLLKTIQYLQNVQKWMKQKMHTNKKRRKIRTMPTCTDRIGAMFHQRWVLTIHMPRSIQRALAQRTTRSFHYSWFCWCAGPQKQPSKKRELSNIQFRASRLSRLSWELYTNENRRKVYTMFKAKCWWFFGRVGKTPEWARWNLPPKWKCFPASELWPLQCDSNSHQTTKTKIYSPRLLSIQPKQS